jgi:uncharacterized protein YciI
MNRIDRDYALLWPSTRRVVPLDCNVCGLFYCKDSPEDRREHRRRHRQVLRIYEPEPIPRLVGCGPFVKVTPRSPRWMRNRLEGAAIMFRREGAFDFAPYSAGEYYNEGKFRHHLIADPTGRVIGAFGTEWTTYCDASPQWTWIWVVPSERRTGHMRATWEMLKATIPGIEPKPPFSFGAAAFFVERNDVSDRIKQIAARRLADELDLQ